MNKRLESDVSAPRISMEQKTPMLFHGYLRNSKKASIMMRAVLNFMVMEDNDWDLMPNINLAKASSTPMPNF